MRMRKKEKKKEEDNRRRKVRKMKEEYGRLQFRFGQKRGTKYWRPYKISSLN